MRKSYGFTLVELLAILVILAIISVVTVPIILNIVENSKKSAAIDSALGYQHAVQNYYLTEVVSDSLQELPNGYKNVSELPDEFKVGGEEPTQNSCIELSKGIVKSFSLKFGDYVVNKSNDGEISVVKGSEAVCSPSIEYSFGCTRERKTVTIEKTGNYKLEVWGAQGGSYNDDAHGGYGGYASGVVFLNQGTTLYIYVGCEGVKAESTLTALGGYNGGGAVDAEWNDPNESRSSGGGATHIALRTGFLSDLAGHEDDILIVAGGGGGVGMNDLAYPGTCDGTGGNGGGFKGTDGNSKEVYYGGGGTQEAGGLGDAFGVAGLFGRSADSSEATSYPGLVSGAGGGYYGGGLSIRTAGGGSGYIGNPLLSNKEMYCYECEENDYSDKKTVSTTNVSEEPISRYAKENDGYAKITYIGG